MNGTDFKGTGSRIRLAIVRAGRQERPATPDDWKSLPDEIPGVLAQSLRNMFVEPQLPGLFRSPVLVAGVHVPGMDMFKALRTLAYRVGAALWLDLRGAACPRLRASRQGTTRAQSDDCREHIAQLQLRWSQQWANVPVHTWRWLHHAVAGLHQRNASNHSTWSLRLAEARVPSFGVFQEGHLFGTLARDGNLAYAIAVAIVFGPSSRELSRADTIDINLGRSRAIDLARARVRIDFESNFPDGVEIPDARVSEVALASIEFDLARGIDLALGSRIALACDPLLCYKACCEMSLLSQAFWPSLERAFTPLAQDVAKGLLGDLHLLGPLSLATAEHAASTPGLPGWLEG